MHKLAGAGMLLSRRIWLVEVMVRRRWLMGLLMRLGRWVVWTVTIRLRCVLLRRLVAGMSSRSVDSILMRVLMVLLMR